MDRQFPIWLVATLLGGPLCVQATSAESIEIPASDSGWYRLDGHDPTNENYAVGGFGGVESFRNFFVFDLSEIAGTVTAATLRLENPAPNPSGVLYQIRDVVTPISTLTSFHSVGPTSTLIFDDLGTGVLFGSGSVIGSSTSSTINEFTLNSSAIAALQSALGGLWAVGGSNGGDPALFAFFNTGVPGLVRTLILHVEQDDPATLLNGLQERVVAVGPGTSLADKVALARMYFAVPDVPAACAVITDFKNQVRAQAGKKLSVTLAADLIQEAQAIMHLMGCD